MILRPSTLFSLCLIGILCQGLIGCAKTVTLSGLGGALNILSLPVGFNIDDLEDDWILTGGAGPEHISPSDVDPLHELSVSSSSEGFSLIRRTDSVLLASPYLHWRWNLAPGNWQYHPVRLLIGFNDGSAHPSRYEGVTDFFSTQTPPLYDRALSVVWGPSALMRGSLNHIQSAISDLQEARYTVRGGHEYVGMWKMESIDLSHLYARAWPEDDASKANVVFIGIGAAKTPSPHSALIGDIRLSR